MEKPTQKIIDASSPALSSGSKPQNDFFRFVFGVRSKYPEYPAYKATFESGFVAFGDRIFLKAISEYHNPTP